MPHAEARVDSYAEVVVLVLVADSLSSRPRPLKADVMSKSVRAEISNAPDNTDLSELLVFGREASSDLPAPAVMMASLLVRLGINRSPVWCCGNLIVVFPARFLAF